MRRLTHRQAQVLRFIANFRAEHGWSPTMREICASFGWTSTRGAIDHCVALERKGCIVRAPKKFRAVTITPAGERFLGQNGILRSTPEAA